METTKMSASIKSWLLLAAIALAPACLGDDPDNLPDTGIAGLRPAKPGHDRITLPPSFTTDLRQSLLATPTGALEVPGSLNHRPRLPTDLIQWAESVSVPQMCASCSVTVVHLQSIDGSSLLVLSDEGEELCRIDAGRDTILSDSCTPGAR
jgi:hypothetical protein